MHTIWLLDFCYTVLMSLKFQVSTNHYLIAFSALILFASDFYVVHLMPLSPRNLFDSLKSIMLYFTVAALFRLLQCYQCLV